MLKLKFKIIVSLFVFCCIFFQLHQISSLQDENSRLKTNQSSLLEEISYYKIDSARTVASVSELRLTVSELKETNSSLLKDIESLNIKLKRVNSASSTSMESNYSIEASLRDSVIIRDSIRILDSIRPLPQVTVQTLNYSTPYITIRGIIDNSKFFGSIQTYDTLVRVQYRVPKKFLFFNCGTKVVKEDFYSKNPHTKINSVETVTIVSKRNKNK